MPTPRIQIGQVMASTTIKASMIPGVPPTIFSKWSYYGPLLDRVVTRDTHCKLLWNIPVFNRKYSSKWSIFHCHVGFTGV